jgi:hypothetical protein
MIQALLQKHDCSSFAVNFIDDIIIHSKNVEEHVEHVKKVLDALTAVNLTIRREKCHFFCTEVKLLGYWLSLDGIRPNYERLCNMMEWSRLTTRKQVQRFCGIINFFRRFIPRASDMIMPIMSQRDKVFKWTPTMKEAYKRIYQALVTGRPILHFPIPNIRLELATDASKTAIGASIFQRVEGDVCYLGFHSRVLTGSELNYSILKKELLSAIFHINYYKHLLFGKFFTLWTDSKVITDVFYKLEDPKTPQRSTLIGWMTKIQDFTFEVKHLPGDKNVLPDMLSRI